MKKSFVISLMVCLCFAGYSHTASIPKVQDVESEDSLRNLAGPLEGARVDREVGLPEKRYSSHYFTNMRAKQYDHAAMQRLLKNMFVGKRNMETIKRSPEESVVDTETETDSSDHQHGDDINGYVILSGQLDDTVITSFLRQLDDASPRFVVGQH